jgi:hypothetical protein
MKALSLALLALAIAAPALAQEREVPKDSARITIPGCIKGRTFTIAAREGHEPTSAELLPGRRFRLSGPRDVLKEIDKRKGQMVEVTGLVRRSELAGPGGVSAGSGRVRIAGGPPQAPLGGGAATNTRLGGTTDAVLDVEGWNPLAESCP